MAALAGAAIEQGNEAKLNLRQRGVRVLSALFFFLFGWSRPRVAVTVTEKVLGFPLPDAAFPLCGSETRPIRVGGQS